MATPCIAAAPCGCMTECEKSSARAVPRVPPSELTAVPASLSATEVAYVDAYPPPVLDGRGASPRRVPRGCVTAQARGPPLLLLLLLQRDERQRATVPGVFRRGADGVLVARLMRGGDGPGAHAQHRPGPRSRAAAADAHSSRDGRDTALTAASLAVLAASAAVMALVARDADVGEAKVRQLDVPVCRDEEVIWLDVSVDDAPLVACSRAPG